MRNPTLSMAASMLSPLGPYQTAEERNNQEQPWIDSLGTEDLDILIGWLRCPVPIEADCPVLEKYIDETADGIAEYVGLAGKRLDQARYRKKLESMLDIPASRMAALARLAALADTNAISAIQCIIAVSDPVVARRIANVAGSIGGETSSLVIMGNASQMERKRLSTYHD